jgi:hypothetical protein
MPDLLGDQARVAELACCYRASQSTERPVNEQHPDASLSRPAVDPTVPQADRDLLLSEGALLSGGAQARSLDLLPAEPERRLATVNGATTGLTAGIVVAITGAAPWAIGVLIFQGAVSWQSTSGRYALMLMEMIVAVTAVVFGTQVARFGQVRAQQAAAAARSRYRGRYLTAEDFDAPARVLLRRAQDAVDTVTNAEVSQAGLLDEAAALAAQEWDIAVSLRDQAQLRARRTEITRDTGLAERANGTPADSIQADGTQAGGTPPRSTTADGTPAAVTPAPVTPASALLRQHLEAARAAEQSVTERITTLERYAAQVQQADDAYRDRRTHARLTELTGAHLDMLARTAADSHGIAELTELTRRIQAIQKGLREG